MTNTQISSEVTRKTFKMVKNSWPNGQKTLEIVEKASQPPKFPNSIMKQNINSLE